MTDVEKLAMVLGVLEGNYKGCAGHVENMGLKTARTGTAQMVSREKGRLNRGND